MTQSQTLQIVPDILSDNRAASTIHPLALWRMTQVVDGKIMRQGFCADQIKVGGSAWSDWEAGKKIPDPESMAKIYMFTLGMVRPDHFYDLPRLSRPARK
jgi:hypothetical protein